MTHASRDPCCCAAGRPACAPRAGSQSARLTSHMVAPDAAGRLPGLRAAPNAAWPAAQPPVKLTFERRSQRVAAAAASPGEEVRSPCCMCRLAMAVCTCMLARAGNSWGGATCMQAQPRATAPRRPPSSRLQNQPIVVSSEGESQEEGAGDKLPPTGAGALGTAAPSAARAARIATLRQMPGRLFEVRRGGAHAGHHSWHTQIAPQVAQHQHAR